MISLSKLLTVTFILLGLTAYAEAQSNNVTLAARTAQGTIPASPGTGTIVLGGTQASGIALNGSYGSATFTLTGGWSGTLAVEGQSCDAAGTWNTIQVFPFTSTTGQTTITANGLYIGTVAGLCALRLRGNTVATAAAVGTITTSSSGGAGGGGGGGAAGSVTQGTVPWVVDVATSNNNLYTALTSAVPAMNATAYNTNSYSTGQTNPVNADLHGNLYVHSNDPCQNGAKVFKPIAVAGAATTNIITNGAAAKIYICQILLTTGIANNVTVIEGTTGGTCGTPAGIFGGSTTGTGFIFAANGGVSIGNGGSMVGQTATNNNDLCIITSASGPLAGGITYVVQ